MRRKEANGAGSHLGEFEVDVELLAFAHRYATSPVKRDILIFFGENQHGWDTADGIARRIGWHTGTVARDLSDLARMGVLKRARLDRSSVFLLSHSPRICSVLSRFVASTRVVGQRC